MGISLGSIDEDMGVTLIDSLTINTSTVQLEYIPTSNTGSLLIGKTVQEEIGATIASTYFRLALTDFTDNLPEDAKFDSINLVLRPNAARYYYGDTTQSQTFHVHQVSEVIEPQDITTLVGSDDVPVYVTGASLFSHQSLDYEEASLGSLTFAPKVKSIDTLNIRLSDAFGQDLFDKIRSGHPDVSSNERLQQYLKGLMIMPDDNNTVILGLNDTLVVDINYSYAGNSGVDVTGKRTMAIANKAYQYNHIAYDRSGTDFAPLTRTERELPVSATHGDLFVQAGTGVVAKLEFPSLKRFVNESNMAINRIELEIEATRQDDGTYLNPDAMMLFVANKYTGVPISFVRSLSSTNFQTASMIPGAKLGINPKYIFNLIDYIKTVNDADYEDKCLYLSVAAPDAFGKTNVAMIAKEDDQPKIKLNIVYTKFK